MTNNEEQVLLKELQAKLMKGRMSKEEELQEKRAFVTKLSELLTLLDGSECSLSDDGKTVILVTGEGEYQDKICVEGDNKMGILEDVMSKFLREEV